MQEDRPNFIFPTGEILHFLGHSQSGSEVNIFHTNGNPKEGQQYYIWQTDTILKSVRRDKEDINMIKRSFHKEDTTTYNNGSPKYTKQRLKHLWQDVHCNDSRGLDMMLQCWTDYADQK
jgi:hypothetical protein